MPDDEIVGIEAAPPSSVVALTPRLQELEREVEDMKQRAQESREAMEAARARMDQMMEEIQKALDTLRGMTAIL
jgi:ElaB/YqjD/DUF883 family membrane-anchored ribosome-binding protein